MSEFCTVKKKKIQLYLYLFLDSESSKYVCIDKS